MMVLSWNLPPILLRKKDSKGCAILMGLSKENKLYKGRVRYETEYFKFLSILLFLFIIHANITGVSLAATPWKHKESGYLSPINLTIGYWGDYDSQELQDTVDKDEENAKRTVTDLR